MVVIKQLFVLAIESIRPASGSNPKRRTRSNHSFDIKIISHVLNPERPRPPVVKIRCYFASIPVTAFSPARGLSSSNEQVESVGKNWRFTSLDDHQFEWR